MELYTTVAYAVSKLATEKYSTSFSGSITLFSKDIQPHIYAIYGLVRIADEVVDTYRGKDVTIVLDDFEQSVYMAMKRGYSTNPIVQAFVLTANSYGISKQLIRPFFESMRMDITPTEYTQKRYETYIYGSAEVVALMCLKVFVGGNDAQYKKLERSASALGAAYQKVNFLRDMAADFSELGRTYFPGVDFAHFNDTNKIAIIKDIKKDFTAARKGAVKLPNNSKNAVCLSIVYYEALLEKLERTSASVIKQKRVRINVAGKAALFAKASVRRRLHLEV